jgi:hypothetical protein
MFGDSSRGSDVARSVAAVCIGDYDPYLLIFFIHPASSVYTQYMTTCQERERHCFDVNLTNGAPNLHDGIAKFA